MSEEQVGGVPSITDLKALRTRILGKAKVARPVTNSAALIETLKGADFAEQVKLAVPNGVDFDVSRFLQSVLRALDENERLLACEPRSVLGCALRCAEIGLMVGGVMQHAFMVPRARRDGRGGFMYEAELSVGYRGMIALAMRSGKIKSITSRVVTDREVEEGRFDLYYEGEKDVLIHRPVLYGDKGDPVMVYCLVRFVDGTFHVEPMDKSEIERIKEMAIQRWNGVDGESPWVTSEMEMWRKSPVRRAFKYLNVQVEGLDRAVGLEEERERGQRQDLARLIDETAGSGEDEPQAGVQNEAQAVVKSAVEPVGVEATAVKALEAVGGTSSVEAAGVEKGAEVMSGAGEVIATAAAGQQSPGQDGKVADEAAGMKEAGEVLAAIAAKKPSVERPAKYRDPVSGVTWNGWGKTPRWLPKDKEQRDGFLIQPAQALAQGGDGAAQAAVSGDQAANGAESSVEASEPTEAGSTPAEAVTAASGAEAQTPDGVAIDAQAKADGCLGAPEDAGVTAGTGVAMGDEESVEVVGPAGDEPETVERREADAPMVAAGDGEA